MRIHPFEASASRAIDRHVDHIGFYTSSFSDVNSTLCKYYLT
jgi:hypothetical protein